MNNGGSGGTLGASATKIASGKPGLGGTGGNGGNGGHGGYGGAGGNGGNGGNGGSGFGGGVFVNSGSLTVYNSTIAVNNLTGGNGGSAGAGGTGGGVVTSSGTPYAAPGGPAGLGGFSNGGAEAQAPNGHAGRSGTVGSSGLSGSSGLPGSSGSSAPAAACTSPEARSRCITRRSPSTRAVCFNREALSRSTTRSWPRMGIPAPASGPTGADYAIAGSAGSAVANHSIFGSDPVGVTIGAGTFVRDAGLDSVLTNNGGPTETIALLAGSGAIGAGQNGLGGVTLFTDQRGFVPPAGVWDVGAYQFRATRAAAPTATLSAPNLAVADYGKTVYEFSVTYASSAGIDVSTLAGAVVQVVPPGGGSPITATVVSTVANGPTDTWGDSQSFTVTYKITPPGGSWTSADNGTYSIALSGSPIDDLAGDLVPTGTLGSFKVQTAKIAVLVKYQAALNLRTGFWSGSLKLINAGTSAFSGPIFILFSLPKGAFLENATGIYGGLPYLEVNVGTLAAGADLQHHRRLQHERRSRQLFNVLLPRQPGIVISPRYRKGY